MWIFVRFDTSKEIISAFQEPVPLYFKAPNIQNL